MVCCSFLAYACELIKLFKIQPKEREYSREIEKKIYVKNVRGIVEGSHFKEVYRDIDALMHEIEEDRKSGAISEVFIPKVGELEQKLEEIVERIKKEGLPRQEGLVYEIIERSVQQLRYLRRDMSNYNFARILPHISNCLKQYLDSPVGKALGVLQTH